MDITVVDKTQYVICKHSFKNNGQSKYFQYIWKVLIKLFIWSYRVFLKMLVRKLIKEFKIL